MSQESSYTNTESLYTDFTLHEGKFITLLRRESEKGPYEMVSRTNSKGIISVLPVTKEGNILLIDEFRIPLWNRVLSIPAGLVDNDIESLEDTVRRELREETGYDSEEISYAFECASSAGLTSETVHCFIAENAYKIGEQSLQGEEDIRVVPVPANEIRSYLRSYEKSGKLVDTKLRALLSVYEDIRGERLL